MFCRKYVVADQDDPLGICLLFYANTSSRIKLIRSGFVYSTVTLFARLRGWSTSVPLITPTW